jgi:rhodanese-related sulfurtransferase
MEEGRHGCSIDEILASARARLDRVAPDDLDREQLDGAVIVDIRPVEQRLRDGALPGAIVIDRNVLEWRLDPSCAHHLPDIGHDTRVVVVCNEGYSSSLAAVSLHDVGLYRATDLIGGYQAWLARLER